MAHAAADCKIVEQPVFIRGRHNNLGEVAPRQFPVILADEKQPIMGGARFPWR
jgi:hypothetical protein